MSAICLQSSCADRRHGKGRKLGLRPNRHFSGRTESEVEEKLLQWQRQNEGKIFNIKKHNIERLDKTARQPMPPDRPLHIDAFSMLVEYEIKPAGAA